MDADRSHETIQSSQKVACPCLGNSLSRNNDDLESLRSPCAVEACFNPVGD